MFLPQLNEVILYSYFVEYHHAEEQREVHYRYMEHELGMLLGAL